ncbi:MAG: sulfotransferase, partial [Bacteroidia bacterium]|nr:sulfotransferase [Bacteroidia bacterium]
MINTKRERRSHKKDRFSFINPSPLLGGQLSVIIKLLRRHRVSLKFRYKLILPVISTILSFPFRWIDHFIYDKKSETIQELNPVFIIGHWRSGTTFLHNLISQDPQFGFLTTYQAVFPELMSVRKILKKIISPFMAKKRPGDEMEMHLDNPQEDEFAMNHLTIHSYYHFMYFPLDYIKLYKSYIRFKNSDKIINEWKQTYDQLLKKTSCI